MLHPCVCFLGVGYRFPVAGSFMAVCGVTVGEKSFATVVPFYCAKSFTPAGYASRCEIPRLLGSYRFLLRVAPRGFLVCSLVFDCLIVI